MYTSVASFDSYQRKAMSAIQALDDVVANQQSRMPNYMSSTDDEKGICLSNRRVDLDMSHKSLHHDTDQRKKMTDAIRVEPIQWKHVSALLM